MVKTFSLEHPGTSCVEIRRDQKLFVSGGWDHRQAALVHSFTHGCGERVCVRGFVLFSRTPSLFVRSPTDVAKIYTSIYLDAGDVHGILSSGHSPTTDVFAGRDALARSAKGEKLALLSFAGISESIWLLCRLLVGYVPYMHCCFSDWSVRSMADRSRFAGRPRKNQPRERGDICTRLLCVTLFSFPPCSAWTDALALFGLANEGYETRIQRFWAGSVVVFFEPCTRVRAVVFHTSATESIELPGCAMKSRSAVNGLQVVVASLAPLVCQTNVCSPHVSVSAILAWERAGTLKLTNERRVRKRCGFM